MGVAIREPCIDVVVHGAGAKLDLEVGLVLEGIATLRRVGEVVFGDVVAVEVVIERIVDDGEIIRSLESLDKLRVGMQGMRAGTWRRVDDNTVIELGGSAQ